MSNRGAGEPVVGEMRRRLGHPAAAATRAKASTLAGEPDQAIGAAGRTPKPGKAVRQHAAANEALKLALHEQRGATHVRSRNRLARSHGVKVHYHRAPSRLVPLFAPAGSASLRSIAVERSGERRRTAGARHPWHVCGLPLPEAPAANKPKALSAASGD